MSHLVAALRAPVRLTTSAWLVALCVAGLSGSASSESSSQVTYDPGRPDMWLDPNAPPPASVAEALDRVRAESWPTYRANSYPELMFLLGWTSDPSSPRCGALAFPAAPGQPHVPASPCRIVLNPEAVIDLDENETVYLQDMTHVWFEGPGSIRVDGDTAFSVGDSSVLFFSNLGIEVKCSGAVGCAGIALTGATRNVLIENTRFVAVSEVPSSSVQGLSLRRGSTTPFAQPSRIWVHNSSFRTSGISADMRFGDDWWIDGCTFLSQSDTNFGCGVRHVNVSQGKAKRITNSTIDMAYRCAPPSGNPFAAGITGMYLHDVDNVPGEGLQVDNVTMFNFPPERSKAIGIDFNTDYNKGMFSNIRFECRRGGQPCKTIGIRLGGDGDATAGVRGHQFSNLYFDRFWAYADPATKFWSCPIVMQTGLTDAMDNTFSNIRFDQVLLSNPSNGGVCPLTSTVNASAVLERNSYHLLDYSDTNRTCISGVGVTSVNSLCRLRADRSTGEIGSGSGTWTIAPDGTLTVKKVIETCPTCP